jgi:hypothetical protein
MIQYVMGAASVEVQAACQRIPAHFSGKPGQILPDFVSRA